MGKSLETNICLETCNLGNTRLVLFLSEVELQALMEAQEGPQEMLAEKKHAPAIVHLNSY